MNVCAKKYFENSKANLPQLSIRRPEYNVGTNEYEYNFPYPFLLIGVANRFALPAVNRPNVYDDSQFILNNSLSINFKQMFQALSIAFMYANRDFGIDNENTEFTKYEGKLENYFNSYLNDQLITTNYGTFLFPLNRIIDFWTREQTLAQPTGTMTRLYELSQDLFNNSDRRLWLSPGKYKILDQPATPAGTEWIPVINQGELYPGFLDFWVNEYLSVSGANNQGGYIGACPFIIDQVSTEARLWIEENGTGTIVAGDRLNPWPTQPDYNLFVNPGECIAQWLREQIEFLTGVAPTFTPYVDPPFGEWGVGQFSDIFTNNIQFAAADGWDWGALALNPASNYNVYFSITTLTGWGETPYMPEFYDLTDLVSIPNTVVLEYKPVE